VEFYSGRPTFRMIDGNQPPDVVTASMDAAIGEASAAGTGPAGPPGESPAVIVCKSPAELEKMRAANQLVARILEELSAMVAPGVTTAALDAAAESKVRAAGAEPAFKGYRGYPATLCASVNEQVVHGIPSAEGAPGRRHRVAGHGCEAERLLRDSRSPCRWARWAKT